MPRCHREAQRRLFEIAEAQQGFFTTKQAKAAGFAENTHSYHVKVGNWIREYRGIYRLALFPMGEHPDLVKGALWSRNRNEAPEGAGVNDAIAVALKVVAVGVGWFREAASAGAFDVHRVAGEHVRSLAEYAVAIAENGITNSANAKAQ